jgi:AcrR family transcriptional regulator
VTAGPGTNVAARTPRGQGERLRERLLDAGVEIVSEQGDASHATIRAVTKRAGVSPTAFYLHFPTREAFLSALRQRGFEEFRAAISEAADSGGDDPAAKLQAGALGYMRFARERPNVYALIFGPDHSSEEGGWDPDDPGPASFNDLIGRVAAYLDQAGRQKADAPRLSLALWTGLHGYVTLRHKAQAMDWPTDEEFAAQLIDAWLRPTAPASSGEPRAGRAA